MKSSSKSPYELCAKSITIYDGSTRSFICFDKKSEKLFQSRFNQNLVTDDEMNVLLSLEYIQLRSKSPFFSYSSQNEGELDFSLLKVLSDLKVLRLEYYSIDLSFFAGFDHLHTLQLDAVNYKNEKNLSYTKALKSLHLSFWDNSNTKYLKSLKSIEHLSLRGQNYSDYSPLKSLSKLKTLNLGYTQAVADESIRDLSPLRELLSLEKLDIRNIKIESLSDLRELTNLKELKCSSNLLKDISAVENLQELTVFDAQFSMYLENASSLSSLSKLARVNLSQTSVIDLSFLKDLSHLKVLRLGTDSRFNDHKPIQDISQIASLKNLEVLHLNGSTANDLQPLSKLKKLKNLSLSPISATDFSPLDQLKELRNVQISAAVQVSSTNFSTFENWSQITTLGLHNMLIDNVDWAEKLKSLKKLDLRFCVIRDCDSLKQLHHLEVLNIDKSTLNSDQILDLKKFLPNTNVMWSKRLIQQSEAEPDSEQLAKYIKDELERRGQLGRKVFINHISPRTGSDNSKIYDVEFKITNAKENEPFGGYWTLVVRDKIIEFYREKED